MKAIWTSDEAEYHGRHVDFDPIWSWPKPVQKPHPPVFVGGNGERVLDRVLEFGDGWMPNRIKPEDERFARRLEELRRRGEEAGREIPVTIYGGTRDPATTERWAEGGVTRMVYWLPPAERGEVERALDAITGFIAEYRGG
jgi:hypothetical protein